MLSNVLYILIIKITMVHPATMRSCLVISSLATEGSIYHLTLSYLSRQGWEVTDKLLLVNLPVLRSYKKNVQKRFKKIVQTCTNQKKLSFSVSSPASYFFFLRCAVALVAAACRYSVCLLPFVGP